MSDLVTEWQCLQDELTREEQSEFVSGLHSILLRKRRREETHNRFEAVMREIRLLRQRIKGLPKLPDPAHIVWAQNVLSYPNGRILAVDTLSDVDDTAIIRIMLMDFGGTIQFDTCVNWGGVLEQQTMRRLGVTAQELWNAPSLVQVWPSLLGALAGTYIVSFGFDRARRLLDMLAVQYDLEPLALIGECLQRRCLLYFAETGFAGFASFCTLVGHSLPASADCTAVDRAHGQLHILQAMAQGVSGVYQTDAICDQQDDDDLNTGRSARWKTQRDYCSEPEQTPEYQAHTGGFQQPSLLLTIPQPVQQPGLPQAKVYALIATEQLPTARFGRAARVPQQSLQQWIQRRQTGAA